MNLRTIANRATQAINPNLSGTARIYTGYTMSAAKRVPTYAAPVPVMLQVQALTKREIEHLDGLNISNATRAAYANLQLSGVDRTNQSGGDLVAVEEAIWLVSAVLEGWTTAGWCKVALTRQVDGLSPPPGVAYNLWGEEQW